MEENEEEISKIRKKVLSRNPSAFEKKIKVADEVPNLLVEDPFDSESKKAIHVKGCNCKKSQCSNNYCECHQHGAKCSEL